MYPPEFTIYFLVHGDLPLLEEIVPMGVAALCDETVCSYDLILVGDGVLPELRADVTRLAEDHWGFDEVRFRSRRRHRAPGDPSNNGHTHLLAAKGRFAIVVEGDVAVMRAGAGDVLRQIRDAFDAASEMCLATRIDDWSNWVWSLRQTSPPLAPNVLSINRVSSHFLIYDVVRLLASCVRNPDFASAFHDDGGHWFNYEDWLSHCFARPQGGGIGFLSGLPIRVHHCDEKQFHGSPFYKRDLPTRLRVLDAARRATAQGEAGASIPEEEVGD
jgi:hypothetical protein